MVNNTYNEAITIVQNSRVVAFAVIKDWMGTKPHYKMICIFDKSSVRQFYWVINITHPDMPAASGQVVLMRDKLSPAYNDFASFVESYMKYLPKAKLLKKAILNTTKMHEMETNVGSLPVDIFESNDPQLANAFVKVNAKLAAGRRGGFF